MIKLPLLHERLQELTLRNNHLRADLAQLQLQVSGSTLNKSCCAFAPAGIVRSHRDAVTGVCVSAEGVVRTCSCDGCINSFDLRLWCEGPDVRVGAQGVDPIQEVGTCLQAIAVSSSDPCIVACGSTDCYPRVWNMDSQQLHRLHGHRGAVNDVDFHPKEVLALATASDDHTAIIWDVEKHAQVRRLSQHSKAVWCVRFLGENTVHDRSVATSSSDQHVRLWDLRSPSLLCALPAPTDQQLVLTANAPCHLLAAGTDRGHILTWDLRTMKNLQSIDISHIRGFRGEITSIAFSACCTYLTVGTSSGTVIAYDLQHRSWIPVHEHGDAVFDMTWGAVWPWRAGATPFLLCASHDGTWSCWIPHSESDATRWLGADVA